MNLISESLKLKLISGKPILLKKSNLFFYHRTIEEIIDYDYIEFLKIVQLFKYSDEDLQKEYNFPGINTFIYLLMNINNETTLSNLIREGFRFFVNGENLRTDMERQIFICSYGELDNIEINKEGFDEIIEYIKIIYDGHLKQQEEENDDNLSEAEKRMKDKFDKLRKMRETAKSKSESGIHSEFSDLLGGFLVRNSNMGLKQVLELPYYTFYFLLKKLRVSDDYDIQLQLMCAGASIDKELHHWLMGDEDEENN